MTSDYKYLALYRSSYRSLRSQEENVAKVVGATSSDGFLVVQSIFMNEHCETRHRASTEHSLTFHGRAIC